LRDIRRHHWEKLLRSARVDVDAALARITAMASALPDHATELARVMQSEGLKHPILDRLPQLLADSTRERLARLASASVGDDA
ncbi:MAG: type II toxin-antitoxin system HipA family toxin, partial [Rhodanobacter sp.]